MEPFKNAKFCFTQQSSDINLSEEVSLKMQVGFWQKMKSKFKFISDTQIGEGRIEFRDKQDWCWKSLLKFPRLN